MHIPIHSRLIRTKSMLTRSIATLLVASAAALAAPGQAQAQVGRQMPSPVSAAQLTELLAEAGISDAAKEPVLKLHEEYFARFREFEKSEVDPALARQQEANFRLTRSVEDAKKDAAMRRRVFQRAAQIDGQFVDEITAKLEPKDSWRVERVRQALARRRAAVLVPGFGPGAKAVEYSLRRAPVWAEVDADTLRISATVLDAYEAELGRAVDRVPEAALSLPVRAAELRDESGLTAPRLPEGGGEGGGEGQATPIDEAWFEKMREIQSRASEDLNKAIGRIRKTHRDGLEQVMPFLPPHQARALRRSLTDAVYPMLRVPGEFDRVYATALAKRKDGEIGRSDWEPILKMAEANELSTRPLIAELMEVADRRTDGGLFGAIMLGGPGTEQSELDEKMEKIRGGLESIDAANAASLRAALGLEAAPARPEREVSINGLNIGGLIGGQVDGQVGGQLEVHAIMVGGDGEMITLSGEDMGEGGLTFGALGSMGGTRGVARPMTREELEALASKLGFTDDSRAVFDEIAARAAEARTEAEKAFKPAPAFVGGDEGGGVSFTITLAQDGEDGVAPDPGNPAALAEAIEKAEETMFDELAAAAAADKADALAIARRARARARLLPGESGAQAVDIVALAEQAELTDSARARIAEPVRAWDETSVAAIRSMKDEVKALEERLRKLFEEATTEETFDRGDGEVSTRRAVSIEGETAEQIEKTETGIKASRARVGERNRRTVDGLVAALDGDDDAQRTLRRAFLRAANPSVYRVARDLEPYFAKAVGIAGKNADGGNDAAVEAIAAVRASWIESREARLESYVVAQEKADAAASDGAGAPYGEIQQFQVRTRERKKLREDLEQIEATAFRKLQETVAATVGPDKAKELGELPVRKRSSMPMIQIGG